MADNVKRSRWLSFFVLFFSAVCISLSQLKIVPMLEELAKSMGITMTQVSWLMSVFTIAGAVLALPGGALMGKLGPKKMLLSLMACLFVGNVLGAFSTASFSALLICRTLEGFSFALIFLTGIVMITKLFSDSNKGLAIGIFSVFPSVGSAIAMNLSAPIVQSLGMSSLWVIAAALAAISFILDALVLENADSLQKEDVPANSPSASRSSSEGALLPEAMVSRIGTAPGESPPVALPEVENPSLLEAFANSRAWLVAVSHGMAAFIVYAFVTIYPSLFSGYYALNQGTANFYASLNGLFNIPVCIIVGFIIDRIGKAPILVIASYILLGFTCLLTTQLNAATYVLHPLLTALFMGVLTPANVSIVPSVARRPALVAYTVAMANLVFFTGNFIAAPIVVGTIEYNGWQSGVYVLTAACALGAVVIAVFLAISRKSAKAPR